MALSTFVSTVSNRRTTLTALPFLLVVVWGLGLLLAVRSAEALRASVILSVLALISLGLFWLIARTEPPGSYFLIVVWTSFALKLAAMAYRFYDPLLADALIYNFAGRRIAAGLAEGVWPEDVAYLGSPFIRVAVGLVYFVTGPTFSGISMLWTWFGLLGMLFFYLSFRTGVPRGNHALYLLLIFLYPSMLLWTSSLGKDALVIFFLGMATYGVARLHTRVELIGLWWLVLGISGTALIRPHIAAGLVIAFGASRLLRPVGSNLFAPIGRLLEVAGLVALTVLALTRAGSYVGLEELSPESVTAFISDVQESSARGGSAFEQVDTTRPLGLAHAIPTVLFRPFPWEAHNTNALIASLEGIGLLLLCLYRWRSILGTIRAAPQHSFALFYCVFILLFIVLFTAIGNFGIIVRQRASQLYPFAFFLLAYLGPPTRERTDR